MENEGNPNEVVQIQQDIEEEEESEKKRTRRIRTTKLDKTRGDHSLRTEHCSRLTRLLTTFIQQRNWKDASGVLSVLLKGAARERFPKENRFKYLAAMELLKKIGNDHIKSTNIKHIYEIWMRKNGAMKKCPPKDKFSILLEFVIFCLTHGNVNDANQAMLSLMQDTEYGSDPLLNMIIGLVYYELWYSCIPEEMKLKSSDILGTSTSSELSGLDSYNPVESSTQGSPDDRDAQSPARGDSSSSIGNNKNHPVESVSNMHRELSNQVFQPHGFYVESSEMNENGEANPGTNLMAASVFSFRGVDACLLPIRLTGTNGNFENSIRIYMAMLNDKYHKAVKHLRSALYSTPPVLASLLPLVQLLLLGDQVEEALTELENICQTSNATLPLRIKAAILECSYSENSTMLSACYEDIMKKDPTCSQYLAKLIAMHKNGDYGIVSLLEMIALHLDASYAASSVWGELASCFLKLSYHEEDQLSVCGNADESIGRSYCTSMNVIPTSFIHGNARKSWKLRCRWWSRRHFSENVHLSELEAGDWELLTFKAACASHLYGQDFPYVVSVHTHLEKEENRDQILVLQLHMKNSVKVLDQLKYEEIILDDYSCNSN